MVDSESLVLVADTRAVCDVVATTLGPFGATKLIVQDNGSVTLTGSGADVLERFDVENPAVALLQSAATGFRAQHGDGSTTLVALTGALLEEGADLVERGLHPTTVERGYRIAFDVADQSLSDHVLPLEEVGAEAVARTALTTTRDPGVRRHLGASIAEAADTVLRENDEGAVDRLNVAVVSRVGGAMAETDLVRGVVLTRDPVVETMPRSVSGGVALVSGTIDLPRGGSETSRRTNLRLSFTPGSFEERQAFADREHEVFERDLERALEAGCAFVATATAVNDSVKRALANAGLLVVQRVADDDLRRLARATGASIVPEFGDLEADALGEASVTVRRVAGRDMTFVEAAENEPIYTLFCRAPDPRRLESFSNAVESAVAAVLDAERAGTVAPGGGAAEMAAARDIRATVTQIAGREQLAVEAAGRALTVVPRLLARSTGLDAGDALIELRNAHAAGEETTGVDVLGGTVAEVLTDDPVAESVATKRACWESAVDLATKLLRIDERLPATDLGTGDEEPAEDRPRPPDR